MCAHLEYSQCVLALLTFLRSCVVIETAAPNEVTRVVLVCCYPSIGINLDPLFFLLVRFSNEIRIGIIIFGQLCHITLIAGINFFYTRYLLTSYTLKLFVFLM